MQTRDIDRAPAYSRPISPPMTCAADVARYLGDLATAEQENFVVLCLNARHRVLSRELVALGSATQCTVSVPDVFRAAIRRNAVAIIVAHNHPSGDHTASHADRMLTLRLSAAGELLGMPVLDHVIVAADGHYSFADAGEMRVE